MSYSALDWALPKVIMDVNAKSCLVVLAYHHNCDTGLCCPSVSTIAEKMGVKSLNTVRKAIKTLEAMGLLTLERVSGDHGEITGTRYTLNLQSMDYLPASKKKGVVHVVKEVHNVKEGHEMNDGGSPHEGGVIHVVKEGASFREGGVVHHVNPNKEIEQVNEQVKGTRNVVPASVDLFTTDSQMVEKPKKTILKKPDGVSDEIWREWLDHKRRVSKTCTQRMVDALVREAEKAGITTEQAMTIQLEKGWRGFEAKYLETSRSISSRGFKEKRQEERHYEMW